MVRECIGVYSLFSFRCESTKDGRMSSRGCGPIDHIANGLATATGLTHSGF